MYSLFMGLWTMLFSKVQYQILILGLDDAGKTTFLEQVKHIYSGSSPPEELKIPPTVGLNIGKLDVSRVRFLLWDLGGQASLRVLWDKYYSESHAIVYLLDATDAVRLDESVRELSKLARDKDLLDAPIIVLANKMDSANAMSVETVVQALGLPPAAAAIAAASSSAAGAAGSLAHSAASIAAAAAATPSLSSASSSSSSSSAAAAAVASPNSCSSAFDGHLVQVLPISALTGQGVAKVIELLQNILPKARRTLILQEKML